MKDNKIIENIKRKSQMKIAISKFEEEDIKIPKIKNIPKIVATVTIAIGVTSGLAFASSVVYDKIWKEPESYTMQRELTQEEKEKCITEEEAKNIGNKYLKKIGFDDETIQDLMLEKDWISQDNVWIMHSEKVSIRIDGNTGNIMCVQIPTWEYKIPNNYGITREEARKVARELLETYRPENDNGEYELVSLKRNSEVDSEAYIWYADFYKKYGDLVNEEEHVNIGWVPTINSLYSLDIKINKYENNEEKISKEDAIKIATEKDKTIEKEQIIVDSRAEIRIKQMNENVYLRENFKTEYENGTLNMEKTGESTYKIKKDAVFYKTEERVRKVWMVFLEYETEWNGYTYYIDATTGEIIGGERYNGFHSEEGLFNDSNNVIEK